MTITQLYDVIQQGPIKPRLAAIIIAALILWAFPAPLYHFVIYYPWLLISYIFNPFLNLLPSLFLLEKAGLLVATVMAGFHTYQYYQQEHPDMTEEEQNKQLRSYQFATTISLYTLLYLMIIRPIAVSTAARAVLAFLPSAIVLLTPIVLLLTAFLAWIFLNIRFAYFSYFSTLISFAVNIALLVFNPVYTIPLQIASLFPFLTSGYHLLNAQGIEEIDLDYEKSPLIIGIATIIGLIIHFGLIIGPAFFQQFFICSGLIGLLSLSFYDKDFGALVGLGLLLTSITSLLFTPALIPCLPSITLLGAIIQIYHIPNSLISGKSTLTITALHSIILTVAMSIAPTSVFIISILKFTGYGALALCLYFGSELKSNRPLIKCHFFGLMLSTISFSISTLCTIFPTMRLLAPITQNIGTISSIISLTSGARFNLSYTSASSDKALSTLLT